MRLTISLVLSLLLVIPAFAGEVGKMTYVEGRVDVFSPGSEKASYAKEGTSINVGDSVRVKSNSKAEVTFLDKTVMRIAQNSKVDVADYQLNADNSRKTATIKLERGKARTIISKMKDAAEFKIETPNAEGTVKGSDVIAYFQGGNSGMLVSEGTLSVFNPAYADTVLSIPAGSAVVVPMKGLPMGPREYLQIEKKLHDEDTSVPDNISSRKGASAIKGTITKLTGDVKVTDKGSLSAHAAKAGEVVNEGSKVVTGADGVVEISFDNGNALYLKPNTDIMILRLILDSKTGEYENIFQSDQGKIKARIEKLSGKSKFEVKTPTAVCGARGTIMYLTIALGGATQASYEGGSGYTTNLISGQTMEVGAGCGASTDSSGSVSEAACDAGGGGAGGTDEGFDPTGGTSEHTSTESTSDNFMNNPDTSVKGAAEDSGGNGSGDGMPGPGNDGPVGDNGPGGQIDIPITVTDPGVLNPPPPPPPQTTSSGRFSGSGSRDFASGNDITATSVSGSRFTTDTWSVTVNGSFNQSGPTLDSFTPFDLVMAGVSKDISGKVDSSWISKMHFNAGHWSSSGAAILIEGASLDANFDGNLHGGTFSGNGTAIHQEGGADTWQASGTGTWTDVDASSGGILYTGDSNPGGFLNNGTSFLASLNQLNNALGAPNIPITDVTLGVSGGPPIVMASDDSGNPGAFVAGGGITGVIMNMRMYETSITQISGIGTGIWAAHILGDYTGPTSNGWDVTVIGGAGSAALTGTQWSDGHWRADVTGTVDGKDITGVAAGTVDTSNSFSGSATGEWQS